MTDNATVRRARPVVLTALAAILGMIPLARSIFWGPMAITIMGGLFVALLVVPALYSLWFRVRGDETADVSDRAEHMDHFDPTLSILHLASVLVSIVTLLSSCLGRLATVPPTRSGRDENEPLRVKPMVLPGRRVGGLNCSAVKQYRAAETECESCGGRSRPLHSEE